MRIGDCSAAARNKQPIFDALLDWLADSASVLEIGAGDGTHARYARRCLPRVRWQASETPAHIEGLSASLADERHAGLATPLMLDVQKPWPKTRYDAVFAANVAHIMSEPAVAALFTGAGRHLVTHGRLCLYGPFFDADETPGPGNLSFDRALRARDPNMGIRRREALDAMAASHGLEPVARLMMPSDNRLLIWQKIHAN